MGGLTFLEGIGPATHCQISVTHRPRTLRYVWHHVLPQVCGGQTQAPNLVSLCDSCHYSIHIIMWNLRSTGVPGVRRWNTQQIAYAQRGYKEALAAGTANLIPKEA